MKLWTRKKARKCFLENGSIFLEELIADCNGVSNPIRFFSSSQILKATDRFGPNCVLSHHEQFIWYKGVIEDRPYAIKKFCKASKLEEGYNDIVLSARVSNYTGFLKLIGCCLEFRFPVLVFENPENGILNLRGSVGSEEGSLLPWNVRLKIAKEVAVAITYLHTAFPRIIIHRDVKPRNVLLDKNWNAKLTDFSLSVTLPEGKTWIEDAVRGTVGYLDTTYLHTGLVTEYTDVFSFGIFMLVLLMGRPSFTLEASESEVLILDSVKKMQERGEPIEFRGDTNDMRPRQMKMFLELALRCCAERNEDRPKMIFVAKELKLIERSLDCNGLKNESDTDEREEEEEPLAIESLGAERPLDLFNTDEREEEEEPLAVESQGAEQPLHLLTASSLNSQWNRWNRSNRGFRILCFVFCFVFAMFIGTQLHIVTNVTQSQKYKA